MTVKLVCQSLAILVPGEAVQYQIYMEEKLVLEI